MSAVPAAATLETHEVTNQPGPFTGRNLHHLDTPLREAALREAGDWLDRRLSALGAALGAAETHEWGVEAERNPPELVAFDRYGRRLDEVRYHPAYHALMTLAMEHRIHDISWTDPGPGAHCAHAAMLALFHSVDAGVMCPVTMTYAAVPTLRAHTEIGGLWLQKIIGGVYDAPLAPIAGKRGLTMGMAMTEKQGGSDVRANTTRAARFKGAGENAWVLRGHKWFCSAPMSDGFLTLAYTDKGLSCFLVPRVRPDGARNTVRLMRLKDKLGNRSNASAEIEYHDAFAELLGEEGRGVNVIIDMVHHTRLGTVAGALGIMRAALGEALHHAAHRRAFQKTLIDQPLMRTVLAELALEYEAAAVLVMRVAKYYESPAPEDRSFARLAVALAKYLVTKRCANFVCECLECHGGGGYIRESPVARLYAEAPLNAIWEGSGNVIALDVIRTIRKEEAALPAYFKEVEEAGAQDPALGAALRDLKADLADGGLDERGARRLAERMALILQGALLTRFAPGPVAATFTGARLGGGGGLTYGAGAGRMDEALLIARATGG
ncbi:acyl-CoA dehydrogenase family protein [Pikeienuella sp. HZG-20]|uniref:acyl-CoA dehydrogenase family protein n=1 Tax=Paludibacillus litoralis TaxID=3133267 RepID=UPI0030EEAFF9